MTHPEAISADVVPFIGTRLLHDEAAQFAHPIDYVGVGNLAVMAHLQVKIDEISSRSFIVLKSEAQRLAIPSLYVATPSAYRLLSRGDDLAQILGKTGQDSIGHTTDYAPVTIARSSGNRGLLGEAAQYARGLFVQLQITPRSNLLTITDNSKWGTKVLANWSDAFKNQTLRKQHDEETVRYHRFGN